MDVGAAFAGSDLAASLSEWLGRVAVASRGTLSSLRLAGPLRLRLVFQAIAPAAPQFVQLEVRLRWAGRGAMLRRAGAAAPCGAARGTTRLAPSPSPPAAPQQVCLSRGREGWDAAAAAAALRHMPALQRLQFRLCFDAEAEDTPQARASWGWLVIWRHRSVACPAATLACSLCTRRRYLRLPQDLVGLMLRQAAPSPTAIALAAEAGIAVPPASPPPPLLRSLRHLALIFPPRSVVPPSAHLPDSLSLMTQLTALKFKRYPVRPGGPV